MVSFTQVLEVNWFILYSIYGQVFFVMGLATGLQWRKQSRLELASALPWLAVFGLTHGFTEWGYVFIPLQALYLDDAIVRILMLLHLGLLTFSFFALFKFGIELLSFKPQQKSFRIVPVIILLLWILALVVRTVIANDPLNLLIAFGDGWSRYFLCFPGSLLAFLGLRYHGRRLRDTVSAHISPYMNGAAIAFLIYAIVGGLIVPTAPFFPANTINYSSIREVIRVPTPVFRSLCGMAMAFFVVRSMEVFQVETNHRIVEMERIQTLGIERERIGRELHDGIIQNIFAAGLSLERMQRQISGENDRVNHIQDILDILNRTILDIRNYIFNLRISEDPNELETILDGLIRDLRLDTMIEVHSQVLGTRCWDLSAEQTSDLTQITREALSNVVKHAMAQNVYVSLNYTEEYVRLEILDDGHGVDLSSIDDGKSPGYGISNMRKRALQINGSFNIESAPGQGFSISVNVPCPNQIDLE